MSTTKISDLTNVDPQHTTKKLNMKQTKASVPPKASVISTVPTPSTIKKVVQYFQTFHDKSQDLDVLSSRVWTKTDDRSFEQQPEYDTAFSLFQQVYHSYHYVRQKNIPRYSGKWKITDQNPTIPFIGTVEKPNIANLKRLATQVHSNVWEITDLENKIEYSEDLVLQTYQETLGVVHKIELKLEKLVILEPGGYLQLEDDRRRLIIQLPTAFTGGEFMVQTETKTEKLDAEKVSWIAAKFAEKQCPVTSGCQVLIIGFPQLSPKVQNYHPQFDTKEIGPPAPTFDVIQSIAKELDGTCLGLVLSDHYDDQPEYNLQMLTGTDKYIVDTLTELGCSFEVKSVLYCRTSSNSTRIPVSKVYLWSSDHTNYWLGRTSEEPQSEIRPPKIPFFDLGLCKQYVFQREVWDCDDFGFESSSSEEDKPDDTYRQKGDIFYFLVPALIIHFPTWWTRARLLWVAKKKNSPSECAISVLPNDIIRAICANLREQNNKKRKREHSKDSEEGENSEDSEDSN